MDATTTTNQRLMTVLLILLIVLVALLIMGIIASWLGMGGMMRSGGMMGMNGQTMNTMLSACSNMMQNFQSP